MTPEHGGLEASMDSVPAATKKRIANKEASDVAYALWYQFVRDDFRRARVFTFEVSRDYGKGVVARGSVGLAKTAVEGAREGWKGEAVAN